METILKAAEKPGAHGRQKFVAIESTHPARRCTSSADLEERSWIGTFQKFCAASADSSTALFEKQVKDLADKVLKNRDVHYAERNAWLVSKVVLEVELEVEKDN